MIEGQKKVEQVKKKFKYLGTVISPNDGRCIDDVKQRIAMGKEAFNKRRELMTGGMSREVKKRLVQSSCIACGAIWVRDMDIEKDGD